MWAGEAKWEWEWEYEGQGRKEKGERRKDEGGDCDYFRSPISWRAARRLVAVVKVWEWIPRVLAWAV
ncbi:MAG: hypothetical protein RL215_3278 [Planctomycetota bacterium]